MDANPKRRRFRFSLRTLLVLVTIACVGFGWLGYKVRQSQQQKKAVEGVNTLDGIVDYEDELMGSIPRGPAWLRKLAGKDLLANVVVVGLGNRQVVDADLLDLKWLPHLEELCLHDTLVTDDGLIFLQGLSQLTKLTLDNTRVTDTGLVHLHGMKNLKELSLHGTLVTDMGRQELQKALPNLEIFR